MEIGRILFPSFLLLSAVAYGAAAQNFPHMDLQEGFGPGFFPSIVAAALCLLALAEAARRLVEHLSERGDRPSGGRRDLLNASLLAGVVVAAVLSMPVVGFVPASTALVFCLSVAMGMRPLWKSALASLLVAVSVHFIFSRGFAVLFVF